MSGVEILSTAEVVIKNGFYWPIFLLLVVVGGIWFGAIVWMDERKWSVTLYLALLGALTGALAGILPAIAIGNRDDVYETQYKVVVSDEASINEFLDTYEIVDQDGKILVVRER